MNKNFKMTVLGMTLSTTLASGTVAYAAPILRCDENRDVWITASSLFVKEEADAKSKKIASLFKGDHVVKIGKKGVFAKIKYGPKLNKIGYVPEQYLSYKPLNNNDKSIKKIMYVNTDDLNMRDAASTASRKLGKLYKGYSVEIDESVKEISFGGYVWTKCKAVIRPNGEKTVRRFWVAKKFLSNSPVVTSKPVAKPEAKPEVNEPVVKPEAKPEVNEPVVKPEAKPEVNEPVAKPEVNEPVAKPETKPEVEAPVVKPVVTEESVEVVADGVVVDVYGKVICSLKKGDKVTLTGEAVGADKDSIELSNGTYGLIHKSMLDADFHSHDEFVYGRPCNQSNLGQSMSTIEMVTTKELKVYNSDCKYYSYVETIPANSHIEIAEDRVNEETGNVEIAYSYEKYVDEKVVIVQGQGFVSISQLVEVL